MDEFTLRRAKKALQAGLDLVHDGKLEEAKRKFRESSEANPSGDSLTYWAWMEHHLGDTDFAIRLCEKAIALDPDFGNPYNDIGSYLMAKGESDAAIPWFEKAIASKRYEPRQFPHVNLGKVYLLKKMPVRALREFKTALKYIPDDPELKELIREIQQSLN